MAREEEPHRAPGRAPKGCIVALVVVVILALVLVILMLTGTQPRYPGADPF